MPELTWPWVLVFCAALFAAFFLAREWLSRRQKNGTHRRPQHSVSTMAHVSLLPTLPQKVITQTDPDRLPPWEVAEELMAMESERKWPPLNLKSFEKQEFERELDEAFLTAPLATRQDPELLHHKEETFSPTPLWTDDCTMPLPAIRPKRMSLTCRVNPDLTVAAGTIQWKASVMEPPKIQAIKQIENVELVLF